MTCTEIGFDRRGTVAWITLNRLAEMNHRRHDVEADLAEPQADDGGGIVVRSRAIALERV